MVSPRFRNVKDQREMESLRDDFITLGYDVKNEGINSILMKKNSWGSIAVGIVSLVIAIIIAFLLWPVSVIILIAYAAYAIYTHNNAPEVLIRIVAEEQPQE